MTCKMTFLSVVLALVCIFPTKLSGSPVLDSLLARIPLEKNDTSLINTYCEIAYRYYIEDPSQILFYARKADSIAEQTQSLKFMMQAKRLIAIGYDMAENNPPKAMHTFQEMYDLALKAKDSISLAQSLSGMAKIYSELGVNDSSLKLNLYVKELFERLGSERKLANSYNSLGNEYAGVNLNDQARLYYLKAIELGEKYEKWHILAGSYFGIGLVYHVEGHLDSCLINLRKGLDLCEQYNLNHQLTGILVSIGQTEADLGNTQSAKKYIMDGLAAAKEYGYKADIFQCLLALSEFFKNQEDYNNSIKYGKEALAFAKNTKINPEIMYLMHKILSDTYNEKGEFDLAMAHLVKHTAYKDSARISAEKNEILKLEIQYQTVQREAEKELLLAENERNEALIQQQFYIILSAILAIGLILIISFFLFRANQTKRQTNELLQHAVNERTYDLNLSNQQLSEALSELERYAILTSHDLREPVRNLKSFTSLLNRRLKEPLIEDATSGQYLQMIDQSASQLNLLIQGMLEFAELRNDPGPLKEISLKHLVEDVKAEEKSLIEEKNAILAYPDLPFIEAYPKHIKILFRNLIRNALIYNQSDPVEVQIMSESMNDGMIQFAIKDNGIGIDPTYHESVFDLFKRLHGRKDHGGSGMGLTMCKKIVEKYNGRIWIENNPYQSGITVFFTLQVEEIV